MSRSFIVHAAAFAIWLHAWCTASGQTEWCEFRGPNGSGRSDTAQLPAEFDDEKNVAWKTPIHGKGWSSPVVWGDQIWMTTAADDGTELFAVCVNLADGQILHDQLVFSVAEPEFCHPTNSYASCTPYLEEGRVYVHFGTYGTACLDSRTGEKLWERRDLHCDHYRGPGSSPIVHDDLVFLTFDGVDVQFVVALDKRTGKNVWRQKRDIDYRTDEGDAKKSYSTPSVIRAGDQWQLMSPSAVESLAYDPATGKELWRVRHGGMNAAARILYENGVVYLCAGEGDSDLIALRPARGGPGAKKVDVLWGTGKSVPNRSSQVIVDGRLFMISDDGIASCLDAASGAPLWTKRIGGTHWASPVAANGLIYFSSQEGRITVVEAGPKYVLRAQNEFPDGFNASPAIVGDALILRSYRNLYRVEKAAKTLR